MATRKRRQFQDVFSEVLSGSLAVDIASVGAGARVTQNITVTGLAIGDPFITYTSSVDPGTLIVFAKATAADTAQLIFENNTAGAIDPALSTYTVVFGKLNADVAV